MRQNEIPCNSCAYYKDGQNMPMSGEHYRCIREHFVALLGGECALCGSVLNLEIHHKTATLTGDSRGRQTRLWDWFKSYKNNNLSLLCHGCHVKYHQE